MLRKPELVVNTHDLIGEGPCWDEKRQVIYWVDILGKKLYGFDTMGGTLKTLDCEQQIGAFVLKDDGTMVCAQEHGYYFLDPASGKAEFIGDPERDIPKNRFNDGKCDPMGRFWAGTMADGTAPVGSLYVLDNGRSITKKLSDTYISNGLCWSADNQTMYYIDSALKRIDAFDYDLKTGDISNRRVVVAMPEDAGLPDGMTIDIDGTLWVAEYDGYRVSRWDPRTGRQIERIAFPTALITSCAFGGPDFDELYVTSGKNGLDPERKKNEELAGALFKVKLDVKGMPFFRYKG